MTPPDKQTHLLQDSAHPTTPLRGWWIALLLLCVSLPPLVVALGVRDGTHTMENISVLSSQETWLRQHEVLRGLDGTLHPEAPVGDRAWLVPTRSGTPRLVKPPLLVWLTLASWIDLEPMTATVEQLLLRARLVSVLTGLIAIGAVFWIGVSLGDRRLGLMAGLILSGMQLFQKQARYASYDIQMTGWITLAMASALWAVNPLGDRSGWRRQVLFWGLAGLAAGLGWMTKGPLALVITVLPLAAMVPLMGRRWWQMARGIAGMSAIALVVILPWHLYILQVAPEAWYWWFREAQAQRSEFKPPWYYLGLIGLMAPWTLWVIAGLFQPWIAAAGPYRRQLLFAWLWFVVVLVFFCIPGAKQQRYVLPVLPAAALLAAAVFRMHQSWAEQGRGDQGVNLVRIPHWLVVGVVSVGFAPVMILQTEGNDWGIFESEMIGPIKWWAAVLIGLMLMGLAAAGARAHWRWQPMRAALLMSLWTAVLTATMWHAYAYDASATHPTRPGAEVVVSIIGNEPIVWVETAQDVRDEPLSPRQINEEYLFYLRRMVLEVWLDRRDPATLDALDRLLASVEDRLYVTGLAAEHTDAILHERGLRIVFDGIYEDHRRTHRLWVYEPHRDIGSDKNPE